VGGNLLIVDTASISLRRGNVSPQKRQWLSLRSKEAVGLPIRGRDLRTRGTGGETYALKDDESSFKKNGEKIGSFNPCGSSDCKVCEGTEIYRDGFKVYDFNSIRERDLRAWRIGGVGPTRTLQGHRKPSEGPCLRSKPSVGKSWNKPEDDPFSRGGGSQACGRSGRGGARLHVVYLDGHIVNWLQQRDRHLRAVSAPCWIQLL
jgi:hypothetical protein